MKAGPKIPMRKSLAMLAALASLPFAGLGKASRLEGPAIVPSPTPRSRTSSNDGITLERIRTRAKVIQQREEIAAWNAQVDAKKRAKLERRNARAISARRG
jgi:hypothetical protein